MEHATGIEPAYSAWEADVLPLNYACIRFLRNKKLVSQHLSSLWWMLRDSNPRPPLRQSGALPAELSIHGFTLVFPSAQLL